MHRTYVASPSQATFSLPPSRRATPAPIPMIYPYPATIPHLQSPEPVSYSMPRFYSGPPPHLPALPQLPDMTHLFRIPSLMMSNRSPTPFTHHYVPQRIRHSMSISSSDYSHLGPRPGRGEQQSMTRASLNEQLLQQQMMRHATPVLPPGISERRRWERCVT